MMTGRISAIALTTILLFSGLAITNEWFSGSAAGAPVYHRGDIVNNETWGGGDVHFVDDQFNVTAGKTLTIEGGAAVKIDAGGSLVVEIGGKLVVNGSQGSTVLVTSNASSPAKGDYEGIVVEDGGIAYLNYTNIRFANKGVDIVGGDTELNYCIINETADLGVEYTGDGAPIINHCVINDTGGGGSGDGGIRITSNGVIIDCEIYNSSDSGIYVAGGTPRIESTHIHDTTGNGMRISGVSAVPVIIDCNIDETGGSNIYMSGNTRTITVYNSTITNTAQDIVEISGASDSKLLQVVILNSTYTNDSFTVPEYGNLTVMWYENAFVKDQAGQPVSGATVNLTNRTGAVVDSKVTNAYGEGYWLEAVEFVYNSSGFFFDKYYDIVVDHLDFDQASTSVWASGFNNTTFVLLDSDDPASSVDMLSPYWRDVQPITVDVTASDVGAGLSDVALWSRFSIDNASWGGWVFHGKDASAPWSFNFDTPNGSGYYEFYSVANDTAGNQEAVPGSNDTICGYDTSAPAADAGVNQTVDQGDLVTFNGTNSTDDLAIANYTWSFNDGEARTLYEAEPGHTFQDAGEFTVTLNVTDFAGKWATDTMKVTVSDVSVPTADAGSDRTVDQGEVVTFDGSGSSDNVGIDNYTWNFSDGGAVLLYGADPSHRFDNAGVFEVTLNVTDEAGNWDADTMRVTVNDTTAPVADAGANQSVNQNDMVILDGSGSSDNVAIANYTWMFRYGDGNVSLYDMGPIFTFDDAGNYTITLNVTDAAGNWDTQTIWIRVNDTEAPSAEAGDNIKIVQGTQVTFNGSGSTDNVGIFDYTWTFNDTSDQILNGKMPTYTFDNAGTFLVTLNVSDAEGNWNNDTLTVTVNDTEMPVADAGPDQTVDQGTRVVFDGSGSSDNVAIEHYEWRFYDGGALEELSGTLLTYSYTFENPGVFIVTLNVSDKCENMGTDSMTVTVNDTEAPMANAANDRIVEQHEVVFFDGSNSTDNHAIAQHVWTFEYYGGTVRLYGEKPYHKFDITGHYEVTLNVTDGADNWDTDTVNVTVLDSTKPFGNAGPETNYVDQGGIVYFNGNKSSDNVGITNYTWRFTYDDVPRVLYGIMPQFTFNIPGTYLITLTVRDAAANENYDTIFVQVNDTTAPKARAAKTMVGSRVTFNASGSEDNVGITSYEWTFLYDGEEKTLQGLEAEFTFEIPGDYNVTFTARDAANNSGVRYVEFTIEGPPPLDSVAPVAKAAASSLRIKDGDEITLNGSGSSDNVGIESFEWAFMYQGKGKFLSGENVNFTFREIGFFNITLTVTDAAGNSHNDTIEIEVQEKRGSGGGGGKGEDKSSNTGTIVVIVLIIIIIIVAALVYLLRRRSSGEDEEEVEAASLLAVDGDGEPVEKECPECGAVMMKDMAYCPECGKVFEGEAEVKTEELDGEEPVPETDEAPIPEDEAVELPGEEEPVKEDEGAPPGPPDEISEGEGEGLLPPEGLLDEAAEEMPVPVEDQSDDIGAGPDDVDGEILPEPTDTPPDEVPDGLPEAPETPVEADPGPEAGEDVTLAAMDPPASVQPLEPETPATEEVPVEIPPEAPVDVIGEISADDAAPEDDAADEPIAVEQAPGESPQEAPGDGMDVPASMGEEGAGKADKDDKEELDLDDLDAELAELGF